MADKKRRPAALQLPAGDESGKKEQTFRKKLLKRKLHAVKEDSFPCESPVGALRPLEGSMTVYLLLILIIVLVLICTLIESGRVSAVSLRLRSLTYMGMDSVFSEFAEPVFEDYGIMVLWEDEDELISEFTEYVSANLDISDLEYTANAALYGMSFKGAAVSQITYITDDNGLIFAQQVYEYMEYYIAQETASKLLEELDIFGQSDTVSSFMDKINEYSDVFTKVEECVSSVAAAIAKAKNITSDPVQLLDELYEAIEAYTEGESTAVFSKTFSKLKTSASTIESALEDIQTETEKYYESVEDAKEAASDLQDELLAESDGLNEEIYESLKEQVDEISEKSADTSADYYAVGADEELVEEYLSELESLEDLFSKLSEGLTQDNAEELLKEVSAYQELFEGFDLEDLGVNLDTEAVEAEDSSILSYISDLVSKGALACVKDDISEKTIETDEMPSVTVDTSDEDTQEDMVSATANKVIFGEYILEHFGNAVTVLDDTALDYEVEYIIAGKETDAANLTAVVNRLVALRSGLNLISILKDSAKKDEAYTLAAAMVGFTGLPLLITAFQMLILTAWSMAEAVVDVKVLLDGEKVPTIKSESQWSLSIEGFKNFTGKDLETLSCESGLEYEDYLRVLLAMQGKQKQYFRTMDMIQADICLNENEDFKMAESFSEVTLLAEYSADALFTSFSWVRSEISSAQGGYSFSITQTYKY